LAGGSAALDDSTRSDSWYQRSIATDAGSSRLNVIRLPNSRLSSSEQADIQQLTCQQQASRVAPTWSVMVKAGSRVIAYAGIVYRTIQVGGSLVAVGGLT
jgi:hypothetical protein